MSSSMQITPFKKITEIPNGKNGFSDLTSDDEFIDVAQTFILKNVRGIRKPYFTGLDAYLFDAQISFGFNAKYVVNSCEFRKPFDLPNQCKLRYKNVDLFQPTLSDVKSALSEIGEAVELIDVGLSSKNLGISFFSSDFENSLDVTLDAVTVNFQ